MWEGARGMIWEGAGGMIDDEVAAVLAGPLMILVSTRDPAGRATIGRGSGILRDKGDGLGVLLSRSLWPGAASGAVDGGPIAVTCARPHDYRTYQIKGMITAVAPAGPADAAEGTAYVARMLGVMGALGVSRLQLSQTLTDRDLLRIDIHPHEVFDQTPGPTAGRPLGAANTPRDAQP